MKPQSNQQRMQQIDTMMDEYGTFCYSNICLNDNTTIGNLRHMWTTDGYGYRSYMDMLSSAGLSCICDGHCTTFEGYTE